VSGLEGVSSYGIVKAFQRYARVAGINGFHIHQLRHTFARLAGEIGGSLADVQEALGHANISTTKVYVQRVGVKRINFPGRLLQGWEVRDD